MKHNQGFTLLEIIVALFIFSIISLIMASGLHSILTTQASVEKNATRFAELQMAITLISRDFEQVMNRPITTANGSQENAFIGTDKTVTFTHAGLANPMGQMQRSTLQRTNYSLSGKNLIRQSFESLDRTPHTPSDERTILKNVSKLSFQYLDHENSFQDRWPPGDQTNEGDLPRAIRISLTLPDLGTISQLYVIPGQKKLVKPN